MRFVIVLCTLQGVSIISAHRFQKYEEEEIPLGLPREKLYKHPEGVPLGRMSKNNQKFVEEKVISVEYFNPPNRNIEDVFYAKQAEKDQRHLLLENGAYTDTDLIMMNRWRGVERRERLWEADMLLAPEQRHLYKTQGKVYEHRAGLQPRFSQPWPGGNVSYFHENEGSIELFGRLRQAMDVWQSAVGCVRFSIPPMMMNFSQEPVTVPVSTTTEDIYYYDIDDAHEPSPAATAAGNVSSTETPDAVNQTHRLRDTADYLRVTVADGCYATVGYQPWSRLVVAEHCSLGVLVHLLGHVLGLAHEHSRPDRHLHVHLHPEHVHTRDFMFLNFQSGGRRCSNESTAGWYDLHSVMHLDPFGLSVSNFSSMSAHKFAKTAHMGATWTEPSYNDALRLRQPGMYDCAAAAAGCPPPRRFCPGHLRAGDCQCVRAAGCLAGREVARGGCSGQLRVGAPHVGSDSGAEQLQLPAVGRGRSCAWLLRAGAGCGRVRLTLSVRMEEAARPAAAALGCGPLTVETHDVDLQDEGRPLRGLLCLADFARWRPAAANVTAVSGGAWLARRVVVSTSAELRVLIRRYPARENSPLARVLNSLTARAETAVDRACHCGLDLH